MRNTVSGVSFVPRSTSRVPSTVSWTTSPCRASTNWAQGMRPGFTYFSARKRSMRASRSAEKPEVLLRLIWFMGSLLGVGRPLALAFRPLASATIFARESRHADRQHRDPWAHARGHHRAAAGPQRGRRADGQAAL